MENKKTSLQKISLSRAAIWLAALLGFSGVSYAQTTLSPSTEAQYRHILRLLKDANYEQAIQEAKALIAQDARFTRGYARLADAAQALNQLPQLRDHFLSLQQQQPDALSAHYGLTVVYRRLKKTDLALVSARQCIKIAPDLAPAYLLLADTYLSVEKSAEAKVYLKSLLSTMPSNSAETAAAIHYALGYLSYAQQQWDEALKAFEQALQASPNLLDAQQYKALSLYYSNRYAEALAAYQALAVAAQASGDLERQARAQANLGPLQRLLGEYAAAHKTLSAGLRAAEQLDDQTLQLMCLSNLSSTLQQQDAYTDALSYGKRWLALSRVMKDLKSIGRAYGHLAITYRAMGDWTQAISVSQESLSLARAIKDEHNVASVLTDLADLELEQQQPALAQPMLEEALSLARKLNNLALEGDVLTVQARLFDMTGNEPAAWETQQQALQLARTMKTPLREGSSLSGLGNLKLKARDWPGAREFFEQSLVLGEKLAAVSLIWQAHTGLAVAASGQGQLEEARRHYHSAIEAIERTRSGLGGEAEKAGFFQDKTEVYRKQIELHWNLAAGVAANPLATQAFHYAERMRARALLDSLRETHFHLDQTLPEDLRQERNQWLNHLAKAEAELQATASSVPPNSERIAEAEQNFRQTSEAMKVWQARLRQQNPNYAAFRYPEPLSVQQVQQLLKQK